VSNFSVCMCLIVLFSLHGSAVNASNAMCRGDGTDFRIELASGELSYLLKAHNEGQLSWSESVETRMKVGTLFLYFDWPI